MPLFRMYWQRLLRRPGSVFIWMALPFVFMTLYQLVFGGSGHDSMPKLGLAIVDQDSSLASQLTRGALEQGPVGDMITLHEARDMAAVDELFKAETASAALILPRGFGTKFLRNEPDTIRLVRNPRHTIGPQIAEGIVGSLATIANGLAGQFSAPLEQARAMADRSQSPTSEEIGKISQQFFVAGQSMQNLTVLGDINVVVVDEKEKEEENFSMAALFFPGLIMFGLLSLSLHVEHRFMLDRTQHVTDRIITSPVAPMRVALQQRVFALSFLFLIGVVSILVAAAIWRIPLVGIGTATLLLFGLAMFIAGWNGSIFAMSKSVRAASAIASTAMVFLSILGGGFFPAEFMPASFQAVIRWMPTGMANLGFTRALTGRELTISLPLFFAMSLALFTIAILLNRRKTR